MRPRLLVYALLAGALAACIDDPQDIGPQDIVRLLMSNDSLELELGDTLRLTGMALDASGAVVSGAELEWGVDRPDILEINESGFAVGLLAGTAVVTARYGDLTAEARVFVAPGPILVLSADSVGFTAQAGGADPAEDTLQITNGGGFSVAGLTVDTIAYGDTAVSGWMMAAIDSGMAPTNLRLSAMVAGLTVPGTYLANVTVSSTDADSSPQVVTASLTITAGDPATLAANAGDSQSAVVGQAVPVPPSVMIRDQFGNPASGVAVSFDVTAGGGSSPVPPVRGARINSGILADTVQTDAQGIATVTSWTLGPTVGQNVLQARIVGDTMIMPVSFTATGTPAGASQLSATQGEGQTATVGTAVAVPPQVHVRDQFGNDVPDATVTFTATAGNGSIVGGTATSDAGGLAAVGTWTLDTQMGLDTLLATIAGVADTVQFIATGTADAADSIAIVAGNAQADTVGATLAVNPQVRTVDQYGNAVAGVTVGFAATGGGGSVGTANTTTDASGLASTSWTLGNSPGANTMTATSAGLTGSPLTFTATATAGAPAAIAITQGDGQTAAADATVAVAPAVRVTDSQGNPVAGVSVTFSATGGGGSVTGGTQTTNASGVATLGSWRMGTVAGPNALQAAANGLTVDFAATATAAAADTIFVVAGDGQSATVGTTVATPPQVRVTDAFGNNVSGTSVSFSANNGGSVTGGAGTTDAGGLLSVGSWTLGTAAGANTLSATSAGLKGSPVAISATGTADAPDSIAIAAGNNQSVAANAEAPVDPAVRVFDQYGNPVAGVEVTFAVALGGGAVTGGVATTDVTGTATVGSWTMGMTIGANQLTATATPAGITDNPVTFDANATAGGPVAVTVDDGDGQAATVGTAVAIAPSAFVEDQFGNPIEGEMVTFTVTGGGGSVLGAMALTDVNGVATVGSWTLGTTTGANTLEATVGGVGTPATFNATGDHAAAARIVVTQEPSATQNGATIPTQPITGLVDQYGNTVDSAGITITANLLGGGALGGTVGEATAPSGAASWTDLAISGLVGNYRLRFSAAGLTPDTSIVIALSAGAPTDIAVSAGNTQIDTVGQALPVDPAVLVTDGSGNPVPGVEVTFAPTGGGGSVTGGVVNTDASGIATVGDWILGTVPGANTLGATATPGGITGNPVGFTATAVHDRPAEVAIDDGDGQSATAGTPVAVAPSVLVTDQYDNPVQGASVTFAVTGGGGSVNPTTAVLTNASGIATATSWTLGSVAGANTLSATVTGTGITGNPASFTATGMAGAAGGLAIDQEPSGSAVAGSPFAQQPVVQLTDGVNPVTDPGVDVTASLASGAGGTLEGTLTVATDANGEAIFTDLRVDGAVGDYSIQFGGTGLSGVTSTVITVTNAAAANIAVDDGDGTTAIVNTAVGTPPQALVTDEFGNPVAGVSVSFAVTGGGGAILPGTAVTTDAAGRATATSWTLGTASGPNTATATSAGLTGSPVTFNATGTADIPDLVVVDDGDGQSAEVDTEVAVDPSVLVTDQYGNPVPDAPVMFAVASGGGSVVGGSTTTGASGIATVGAWTLGETAGPNSLTATVTGGGITGNPVTFTATGTAGTATTIALESGGGQVATVGTAVTPPVVLVTDQFGNPVQGVSVTFTPSGDGQVTGGGPTTDVDGFASPTTWTVATAAGANTLTATSTGLDGSPLAIGATGTADVATTIAIDAGSGQIATVGTAVSTAPRALVTDQYGNPVSGVAVTFAVTGGGGTVDPTTAIATDASGLAAVTTWTLGTAAGDNTLSATSTGLTNSPLAFTATATADVATDIALSQGDAQVDTVNQVLGLTPRVLVTDQYGNPVGGHNVTFAVGLGGGSVLGGNSTTDASGFALPTSWRLGTAVGANTLTATSAGLDGSPVTFTATAVHDAPSASVSLVSSNVPSFTAQSGSGAATITVTVTDQFANPISGETVALAVSGSGNGITQPAGTTNGSGQITGTFGSTQAVNKIVSATVGGVLLLNQTASVNVLPDVPDADVSTLVSSQATIGASNGNDTTTITVTVLDQFGNPVSGQSVDLANTSMGTFVAGSGVSSGAGVYRTTFYASTPLGDRIISAEVNSSLEITQTATVSLTAGPVSAANSEVAQGLSGITASGGTSTSTITVTARDQFNNAVSGAVVSLNSNQTGAAFTAPGSTNGSGVATSSFSSTNAALHTITGIAGGVGITDNAQVTVNPAAANAGQTLIAVDDPDIYAADNTAAGVVGYRSVVTVTVRDVYGNNRQGDIVGFGSTGSNNGFRVSTANATVSSTDTTDASGIAQRVFYSTTAQGKTVSATGTSISENVGVTVEAAAYDASVSTMDATEPLTAGGTSTVSGYVRDAYGNGINNRQVGVFLTNTTGVSYPKQLDTTSTNIVPGYYSVTWSSTLATTKTVRIFVYTTPLPSSGGSGYMTTTDDVFVDHATASSIALNGYTIQTGRVGTSVAAEPSFLVTDTYGNPVDGISVSFSVSGGGTRSPTSASTNSSGIASVTNWVLGGSNAVITTNGTTYEGHMLNQLTGAFSIYSTTASAYSRYEWTEDVAPIINGGTCNGCHYVNWTRAAIVNQLDQNPGGYTACSGYYLVLAGNSTASLIYRKTTTSWLCGSRMPDGGPYLSALQQKYIESWIEDGAPNN